MKLFVKHNKQGEILSVSKVNVMPQQLTQPYQVETGDESVLEVAMQGEFADIDPLKVHQNYVVDVAQKKLKRKG